MRTTLPVIAAILSLTISACQTTTKTTSSSDRFAEADTNHDGKLDRNEARDFYVGAVFASRDLNHDGNLLWSEWHVPGATESKARFDAADKDKNGSLSLAEAKAYAAQRGVLADNFRAADANHDGFLTREEAQAYSGSHEGPPR
jgi:hypothetical protein